MISLAEAYEIPRKLLDSPEIQIYWPENGFGYPVAEITRLDYTSNLHSDGWTPFFHDFDSSVRVYEPCAAGEEQSVHRSVDPIFFGYADRLYLKMGEETVGLFPDGLPDDGPEVDHVVKMPRSVIAYDPEANQLLLVDEYSVPWLIIRDGDFWMDSEAMLGG